MKGPFTAEHERLRDEVRRFVAQRAHAARRSLGTPWTAAAARGRRLRRARLVLARSVGQAVLAEELPRCDSLGLALSVFVQSNLIAPMLRELGRRRNSVTG